MNPANLLTCDHREAVANLLFLFIKLFLKQLCPYGGMRIVSSVPFLRVIHF
jgi:hypothetical protein